MTWNEGIPPETAIGPMGWVRAMMRGSVLGGLTFGCLLLLLAIRLIERPLCGQSRPLTHRITQFVCRSAFVILGIRFRAQGRVMQGPGAVVANHASWLDIFALHACQRVCFVAKADVARWPAIGWLARATGTLFIRRDPGAATAQVAVIRERLALGHKLLFFPEGTSTDGLQVLAFKPTLFAAFFADGPFDTLQVQPVTVRYTAAPGTDPRQYGWWGDMGFGPHLLSTLAAARQGAVTVIYHAPLRVADFADRKTLAATAETVVRSGLNCAT